MIFRLRPWLQQCVAWLTLLAAPLCILESDALAQVAFGGLRGRVVDADFGQPVPGARVTIPEANVSVSTDATGRFLFGQVPPGVYTLTLGKEGFVRQNVGDVLVSGGAIKEMELKLASDVFDLDELVLEEEDFAAPAEVSLIDDRKELATFVDSISSALIAQSGARDAGDVLRRGVGTNVVDGRYVVVRGLADRYTNVLLNNGRLPSSDPDRRAVNVDVFPGSLIESISTSKTFTPDQPGESTGGSVNIRTKAFPDKFTFEAGVGVEFNTNATFNDRFLTYPGGGAGIFGSDSDSRRLPDSARTSERLTVEQTFQPRTLDEARRFDRLTRGFTPVFGTSQKEAPLNHSFGFSVGDRFSFFGRPLGVLLSGSYRRKFTLETPRQQRRYSFTAEGVALAAFSQEVRGLDESQASGLLSLGYELHEDHTLGFTLLVNNSAVDEAVDQIQPAIGDRPNEIVLNDDSGLRREILHYTERTLTTAQLRGDHKLTGLRDAEAHWNVFTGESTQDEPDFRSFVSNFNPATGFYRQRGENARLPFLRRFFRDLRDENYGGLLDIKVPIFDEESASYFQIGGAFDHTSRVFEQRGFGYTQGGTLGPRFFQSPDGETTFADAFFNLGAVGLLSNQAPFAGSVVFDIGDFPGSYTAVQNIPAGYLLWDVALASTLRLQVGARVEQTDIQVRAEPFTDTSRLDLLARFGNGTANINQADLLPSISASWDFFKDMKLRLAGSRTIARPSLKELAPVISPEFVEELFFVGNPNLEVSEIYNADLRLEWFPRAGEVVAASLFTKKIFNTLELAAAQIAEPPGAIGVENFPEGEVFGIEFETRKRLDQLGPWLRNWDFSFNYSFIYSNVQLSETEKFARSITGAATSGRRRLQGQPDYTLNAGLNYTEPEWGFSAGAFYNVTGPFIARVFSGSPDLVELPAPSLDIFLSKKIMDNWKLTFRVKNLLNPTYRQVYNFDDSDQFLYRSFRRGTDYSLALSFTW